MTTPSVPPGRGPGTRGGPNRPGKSKVRRTPQVKKAARPRRTDADRALADQLLAAARTGADVRARKVRRLKAAIKVRAYENDLKFAVAMGRVLEMLGDWGGPGRVGESEFQARPAARNGGHAGPAVRKKSKTRI